jgi:hypothetical protein
MGACRLCYMSPLRRAAALAVPLVTSALLAALAPGDAGAQTLRGSKAKVERAYEFARRRGIAFTASREDVRDGVAEGDYVRLRPSANVRLKGVTEPYVRPATRDFVVSLGAKYRKACGGQMVVTSAIRPASVQRRLANGVEKSVHPTGMAVDLRSPRGSCRTWLRRELLAQTRSGAVDATEERRPAHFHVIVFRAP